MLITHTSNFFVAVKNLCGLHPVIASAGADKESDKRDKRRAPLHSVRQRGSATGQAGVQPLAGAAKTRASLERLPQSAK